MGPLSYFSAYFVADPIFSKVRLRASISFWLFYFLGYCRCPGQGQSSVPVGSSPEKPHQRIRRVSSRSAQQKTFNCCQKGDAAERKGQRELCWLCEVYLHRPGKQNVGLAEELLGFLLSPSLFPCLPKSCSVPRSCGSVGCGGLGLGTADELPSAATAALLLIHF